MPYAGIDFAQAPLAVGVFGVFRAIALRRRRGDGRRDPGTLDAPQLIQLRPHAALAGGCDVFRTLRLRGSVAAQ